MSLNGKFVKLPKKTAKKNFNIRDELKSSQKSNTSYLSVQARKQMPADIFKKQKKFWRATDETKHHNQQQLDNDGQN